MPAYFIFFVGINIDKFILIKLPWAGNYPYFSNGEQAEELRKSYSETSWGMDLQRLECLIPSTGSVSMLPFTCSKPGVPDPISGDHMLALICSGYVS